MSRNRTVVITIALMLGLFLASMEVTVVATAMPTIVAELGGLASYSWVFSIYLLTSTITLPLYGKLSDLYGRRPVYAIAVALFLAGSLLCGQAGSLNQLIAYRAVQGLGAGGLIPLAFIIIGDMFSFKQRATMQGVFSSVWGVSSIVGPLLGGFLVERVSWPWVFYINLGPGLLAGLLVWGAWRDPAREPGRQVSVDYAGAGLLTAGVISLLLGLFQIGTALSWMLIGLAVLLFAALLWVEKRAPDPVLPLSLFRDRMFAVACLHGVLAGGAIFGSVAFVPLFVQAVMETGPTVAGAALTPLIIGWTIASVVGARLLLRLSYRTVALAGTALFTLGALATVRLSVDTTYPELLAALALMGAGMGLSIPAFLIAVQSAVPRQVLGAATSTLQFSRNIGGTVGTSLMGAVLSLRLFAGLRAAGIDPASLPLDSLLDPVARAGTDLAAQAAVRSILASAVQAIFVAAFVASALSLVVTVFTPGRLQATAPPGGEGRPEASRTPVPGP